MNALFALAAFGLSALVIVAFLIMIHAPAPKRKQTILPRNQRENENKN